MSYTKIRFVSRVLREKFGVIGEVAARYIEAGYSVRVKHPTRHGDIHILANGNGQRLVIEVFDKPGNVPERVVQDLVKKAQLVRGKPILVLYGKGPQLDDNIYRLCKELGIKIRRVAAQ